MLKKKDQGVPLRALAVSNEVVLHLCWKGDVFHSGEKPWLLLFFARVRLMWLLWCCGEDE